MVVVRLARWKEFMRVRVALIWIHLLIIYMIIYVCIYIFSISYTALLILLYLTYNIPYISTYKVLFIFEQDIPLYLYAYFVYVLY